MQKRTPTSDGRSGIQSSTVNYERRQVLKALGALLGTVPAFTFPLQAQERVPPSGGEDAFAVILSDLQKEAQAAACVRSERGGPRLFINDKEWFPFFAVSTNLLATASSYRSAGIRLLHPLLGVDDCWIGPGRYSWKEVDRYLIHLLALVPDAYLLPRLHLYAPLWWKTAHPEELIRYGIPVDPAARALEPRRIDSGFDWNSFVDADCASLASDAWKTEMGEALRAFIRHMESSPLRSRIIGYHVASGITGEWHYTGSRFLPDYSAPMEKAVGPIPSVQQRITTTHGLFRDPAHEADVIRFYEKLHACTADTGLFFCKIVKDETQRRILAGLFNCYLLENVMIQEAGHLAPDRILRSPDVDFIASPYSYLHTNDPSLQRWESDLFDDAGNWLGRARGVGGDGGLRVMSESIKRHGKLFISEMDPSTYLEPQRSMKGGSGNNTVEGSVRILQRDLGQMFTTGIGGWLFDFGHLSPPYRAGKGWYDDPPLISEIARWARRGESRATMRIDSVAEIVAVYDPRSFFVTRHWKAEEPWSGYGVSLTDFFNHWMLNAQARTIHHIGAPVDFLYYSDLSSSDLQRYRLLLFPNLYFLSQEETANLRTLLRSSGATAAWWYAPGYVTPERLDLKQMESLTGFQLEEHGTAGPMMVEIPSSKIHPGFSGKYGLRGDYAPRFSVVDRSPATDHLGHWTDSGKGAVAIREYDGWTSFFTGTGPVPAEVLRWLARRAGARLWSDKPDVVRASKDSAMIIASESGLRTLSLPVAMASENNLPSLIHRLSMEFGEVVTLFAKPD